MSHTTIIDTPAGIARFKLLQLKHGLALEMKTGMKLSRGSLLTYINENYGQKFRRKQQAYEFICGLLEEGA